MIVDLRISAAARVLCDRQAAACQVDAEDLWKTYFDDFYSDAKAALAAADAARVLPAGETVLLGFSDDEVAALFCDKCGRDDCDCEVAR